MVRLLINAGADVNGTPSQTLSENLAPLDYARLADDDNFIEEMLVKAGAKERGAEQVRKTIEASQVVNSRGEIVTPSGKTISKAQSKAMFAGAAKLLYQQRALDAAQNSVEETKRGIVDGK